MDRTFLGFSLPEWCSTSHLRELNGATSGDPLEMAVRLAAENVRQATGGPFGATIAESASGRVIAVGVNLVEKARNPLLHAECVAIASACRALSTHSLRLEGERALTLYSSSEPCLMCLGAIHWCGVRHVVYAAGADVAESVGFDEGPAREECIRQMKEGGVSFEQRGAPAPVLELMRAYQQANGTIYNG
jgi:tRNA(Arg) A34 adenosine deaminase TadA